MTALRVHMVGAGAMGSLFGFLLAEAGCAVTLVDPWQEHLDAVARDGLTLEDGSVTRTCRTLRVAANPAEACALAGPADVLCIFVKAAHTAEAVHAARACMTAETLVLTLQNGLGNIEAIRDAGIVSFAAGVTACGATMLGPGRVRLAGKGETILGLAGDFAPPSLASILDRLCVSFDAARLPWRLTDNIPGHIWTKLLVNVGINAITALCAVPNGVMASDPDARALLEAAVREGAAVAAALGIDLEVPDPVTHALAVAHSTASNRSSMLQDLSANRPTEIAVINAAVADRAKALGIPAPVNETLAALVRIAERRPAHAGTHDGPHAGPHE